MIQFIKFFNKQNNSTYIVYGDIRTPLKYKNMHGNAEDQTQHSATFVYFEFYTLCITSKRINILKQVNYLFILFSL